MIALLEMPLMRRLVPLAFALLVAAAVFEMIRRRKLREEFATMWLTGAIGLIVLAIFPEILFWLQDILRTNFLTLVVLTGFGMVAMILLHLTVLASRQSTQIRRLSQRLAIQNQELASLKSDAAADTPADLPAGAEDDSPDEPGESN